MLENHHPPVSYFHGFLSEDTKTCCGVCVSPHKHLSLFPNFEHEITVTTTIARRTHWRRGRSQHDELVDGSGKKIMELTVRITPCRFPRFCPAVNVNVAVKTGV